MSNRIRQMREARGLSQADLARASGMDHTAVSRMERRRDRPEPDTLRRLAPALGVHWMELLPEEDVRALIADVDAYRRAVSP